MKILKFPLARIFIGFLFGILLTRIVSLDCLFAFSVLAITIVGLLLCSFWSKKSSFAKFLFGLLVLTASICIGVSTSIVHNESTKTYHYIHQVNDEEWNHVMELQLTEKLKSTSKNYRYVSLVKFVDGKISTGKIILNISRKQNISNLRIGTNLLVNGSVFRNKNPLNPNLFDYGNYLENQQIYAQVYAKHISIGKYEPSFRAGFANFRDRIISNLSHSGISKEKLNVLNALILGQQQDISPEVLKDYQYAGAVHVLSVSGLHVGFILIFITYLLKPIGNSRKSSLIKLFIVITSLWAFAVLTGLSPSIVRSATMFSFVAVGTHLRRTVNMYHTLLVSMLLILLFKPSFLYDVGFQLSYLALFFILWLQPLLSTIWDPQNRVVKYFWDILTVSFAAQIGAMPLSIYYFHQFPGLFFVTNLLILPLLGIIMAAGVISVLIAVFTNVPFFIAKIVEWLIGLLNLIIHWVASIDAFVIRNISFSKEMLLSSYLAVLLIILWVKMPNFKRLALTFLSIILLQSIFIYQKRETLNNNELIIFSSRKSTIFTERLGSEVTVFSNDSILKTIDNNLLIQSYLVGNFCKIKSKQTLQNLMYFKNRKVLVIDSSCVYPNEIQPDILVIIQAPKLNLERLLKLYKPKEIVVDGSNYKSYIKLWEVTCRKEKIPFHNINEKGFYKI